MQLRPCVQCRRHVSFDAVRCPFCARGLATSPPFPAIAPVGRFSRAAVFAGALAGGCWSSSSPRDTTVDNQQQQVETKRPLVPGTIRGVTLRSTGGTMAGFTVILRREDGDEKRAITDHTGKFEFTGLEPGNYTVTYDSNHPRHPPVPQSVTLEPEAGQEVNLMVYLPEPDRGPCCKPYGAPPARRRIV